MTEVKQETAAGVVRVMCTIYLPEMPESAVIAFRRKVNEIVTQYAGASFEMRLSETRSPPGRQ